MDDHDDAAAFDADALRREYDPEARARALQSLLVEKELLSTEAVDRIVATYEDEIGPLNGARVVARAWTDDAFRDRLLDDGTAAIESMNIDVDTETMDVEVKANDPSTHNLVVCTLCSCYPWAVLGLPPTWYKTPEYRSRAVRDPRGLLREDFDLDLDDDVEIEVWDSTSELRYMVLPERPPGTEGLDESELVERVTRNAMIGVDRLGGGYAASDGGTVTASSKKLADLDPDRPTFEAPWQARSFALAVALTEAGPDTDGVGNGRPWKTFQRRLVAEIDRDESAPYYEQWLAALERLVVEEGLLGGSVVADRADEFAAGDRTAHEFVDGDPHGHVDGDGHGHGHGHGDSHGHSHDHH